VPTTASVFRVPKGIKECEYACYSYLHDFIHITHVPFGVNRIGIDVIYYTMILTSVFVPRIVEQPLI